MPHFFAPGSEEHMDLWWFSCLCAMEQSNALPPGGGEYMARIIGEYNLRLPPHWARPILEIKEKP